MYYLPSKGVVCAYLNCTVCDFVSRTHDCTKWNTERLLLVLPDSILHHTFQRQILNSS